MVLPSRRSSVPGCCRSTSSAAGAAVHFRIAGICGRSGRELSMEHDDVVSMVVGTEAPVQPSESEPVRRVRPEAGPGQGKARDQARVGRTGVVRGQHPRRVDSDRMAPTPLVPSPPDGCPSSDPRSRPRTHQATQEASRSRLSRRARVSTQRRRPESNRCRRLCRPLRSHSATSPGPPRVAAALSLRRARRFGA